MWKGKQENAMFQKKGSRFWALPVRDLEHVKAMLNQKNGGTSRFPGAHGLRFHLSELFDSQRATGTRV